jgi:hypothetical protein
VIEIEVQNETHQTQERLRFASVPRIGEGLRLREPDGCWASYDVLDVWYQKAGFGDVWIPYLHVCLTAGEASVPAPVAQIRPAADELRVPQARQTAPNLAAAPTVVSARLTTQRETV